MSRRVCILLPGFVGRINVTVRFVTREELARELLAAQADRSVTAAAEIARTGADVAVTRQRGIA